MRKTVCVWIALTGLLVAAPAWAGGKKTAEIVRRAYAQYAEQNFEGALKMLNQALKLPGNSREQLVKIYHLWGLCLGSIGHYDPAKQAFARALALDPGLRLGTRVAPRIRQPFQELLQNKPKPLDVRIQAPQAREGHPLVVIADVVHDPVQLAQAIRLGFRRGGAAKFSWVRARLRGTGKHRVKVPAVTWAGAKATGGPVFWIAVVEDQFGGQLMNIGHADNPYALRVTTGEETKVTAAPVAEEAWYEKWWVWTLIGGVVVAGATTGVVLATSSEPSGPARFSLEFSTSP